MITVAIIKLSYFSGWNGNVKFNYLIEDKNSGGIGKYYVILSRLFNALKYKLWDWSIFN